jgi:glutamate/tyrosine decarboxylase-like PLP-dependent enzyme
MKNELQEEQSLDPQDWAAMRALGHRMMDDMMDYLETIRERPIWQQPTEEVKRFLKQPLPESPSAIEEIYDDFLTYILPFNKGTVTPRFWSWVQGTGTPLGMLADMLSSGMNPNNTIGDHAAMYVDAQVVEWCKEMMGFPKSGSGLLVSGGSIANITAITVARNAFTQQQVREKGLLGLEKPLVMYASAETHACQQKAAELLGLGNEGLRRVPVLPNYQMDTNALRSMITDDLAKGFAPFCVTGNAGTVNTGAIDDLTTIADICQEFGLWFHIDGAFGALPKLLPEFQDKLGAIERADSLAFDLHKWMYMNYEVGCVLVRDGAKHRASFAITPAYLIRHERGLSAGLDSVNNYGLELSRGFKALKVWMSIREHGIDKYRQMIRQNIAQVQYLAQLVEENPDLELCAPVPLNLICFRFCPSEGTDQDLNVVNKEILMRLHEQAIALPSYTFLNGKYAIRVANTNHRSTRSDFEVLAQETVRLGREILGGA